MYAVFGLVAATAVSTAALGGVIYEGGTYSSIAPFDAGSFDETIDPSGDSVYHQIYNTYGEGVSVYAHLQGGQNQLTADIVFGGGFLQGAYRFHFSLDAAADVTLSASGDVSSSILHVSEGVSGGVVLDAEGIQSATLAAGDYYLLFLQDWSGNDTTATVMALQFTEIPAPGALALLGLAGLTRRRRR